MDMFGTIVFQISDCLSFQHFFDPVDYLWLLFENSSFRNIWRITSLGSNFVWCSWIHFTLTKTMNKLISTKTPCLYINGWSVQDGNITTYSQLAQNWNLSAKNWKNFSFITPSHFTMLSKKRLKISSLFVV